MKHTKEEIIRALEVIKETCVERAECEGCPFFNGAVPFNCKIQHGNPEYWKINNEQVVWRAFR